MNQLEHKQKRSGEEYTFRNTGKTDESADY